MVLFPYSTFSLHPQKLALSLFMFGVLTDHPDHPFSFHDLTLVANLLDRSSNFHCRYPILEEVGFKLSNPPFPLSEKGTGEPFISPEK